MLTLALVLALGALTFALIGISLLLSRNDRYPSEPKCEACDGRGDGPWDMTCQVCDGRGYQALSENTASPRYPSVTEEP